LSPFFLLHSRTWRPFNQSINQSKRIYIAPCIPQIQRRLADGLSEVDAMIQISFKVFFESEYSVSVNNIDRQTVPQKGAATQNARLASSVRVLGTIRLCQVLYWQWSNFPTMQMPNGMEQKCQVLEFGYFSTLVNLASYLKHVKRRASYYRHVQYTVPVCTALVVCWRHQHNNNVVNIVYHTTPLVERSKNLIRCPNFYTPSVLLSPFRVNMSEFRNDI